MQLKAIFTRWIDNIASLIEAWLALLPARESVLVTQVNEYLTIRRSGALDSILGRVATGNKIPDSMANALRKHSIIFEIGADKVVTRHLTLPIKAQEFLQGIVRNQIERLSPWPPAQAIYGIEAEPNRTDLGTLSVRILITSSASVDAICSKLAESGLPPDKIAVRTDAATDAALLTLWSRPVQGAQHYKIDLARIIISSLAGLVLLSAAVSSWANYSINAISAELEEVRTRAEVLQHQSQSSGKPQNIALLKPPQRAWVLKESSPVAVLILEALSRALPDSAYLTELQLDNATLRIIGLAADAPSLVGALEQSGHFSAVHFFAPTTKGQKNTLYKFYIETRVEDQPRFAGN